MSKAAESCTATSLRDTASLRQASPYLLISPSSVLFHSSLSSDFSSTFPFANVIAGITQDPQLHLIPCQAYLPTFDLHFGHSSLPSTFPCSSSERIHESGSRKRWAQVRDSGKGLVWGSWGWGIRNWDCAKVLLLIGCQYLPLTCVEHIEEAVKN